MNGVFTASPCGIFSPPPLPDPSRQIRLLRFRPRVPPNDYLCLESSVWNLDEAPSYNAISYTWGTPPMRSITVDQATLYVQRNCQEALYQLRDHDRRHYFWIDSICIDQQNEEEKGTQVGMMYTIFERARQVCACMGNRGHSFERLATVSAAFCKVAAAIPFGVVENGSIWSRLEYSLQGDEELVGDLHVLDGNAYWRRLWIMPEIMAGGPDTVVIIGQSCVIPIGCLEIILKAISYQFNAERISLLQDTLVILRSSTVSHTELLENASQFQCTDPRDRLYAFWEIIDWSALLPDMIGPDYTLSAWRLALKMAPTLNLRSMLPMLRALGINGKSHEMQELVVSRDVETYQSSPATSLNTSPRFGWQNRLLADGTQMKTICYVLSGEAGSMSLDCIGAWYAWREREWRAYPWHSGSLSDPPSQAKIKETSAAVLELVSGDDIPWTDVAELHIDRRLSFHPYLICCDAKPGDVLVDIDRGPTLKRDPILLLRHSDGSQYDVVGQALAINGFRLGCPEVWASHQPEATLGRHSCFRAFVELTMTAQDALLLVAQDLHGDDGTYVENVWDSIPRLSVKPIEAHKAAVRLTDVEYPSIRPAEREIESDHQGFYEIVPIGQTDVC